jgi:putative ABC transport system ATP-binding protein
MGSTPVISARALRKDYGKGTVLTHAVAGIDLDVMTGETVAITGPSGCGKSTLLHLLSGLDRPSDGTVLLAGHRVDQMGERGLARLRRGVTGFVFQAFHLMDELTAVENVELAALLSDRARHLPSMLSGGHRQRVAIARALVNQPAVVFADEPTGNLDSAATTDVLRVFGQLRPAGQTLVIVTHDDRVAATANRVVRMRDGILAGQPGRADGPPAALTGAEG